MTDLKFCCSLIGAAEDAESADTKDTHHNLLDRILQDHLDTAKEHVKNREILEQLQFSMHAEIKIVTETLHAVQVG